MNWKMQWVVVPLLLLTALAGTGVAGEADVLEVRVGRTLHMTFDFRVTVRHEDQGPSHYCDKWEILDPDGNVLATRILYHPHVNEQPFTRRLDNVKIPASVRKVTVRAHDNVHGFGGKTMDVVLPW